MMREFKPHMMPVQQYRDEASRLGLLTARESDVSRLVAEGLTNKQIGERLFISAVTVHHHLKSVFTKLDIGSRFELIVLCYRHRLVAPPAMTQVLPGKTTRAAASPGAGTRPDPQERRP